MELSVLTYTIRSGGLDWMARYLAMQTFPKEKFEWIVVDGFYEDRKEELGDLCRSLGIHLIHVPEPELPYTCLDYNIASNGNLALAHVTTPNIVIIDDWHIFPQNLLESHMKYLAMGYAAIPQWIHVEHVVPTGEEYQSGYEGFISREVTSRIHEPDQRLRALRGIKKSQVVVDAPPSWWWPNATSVLSKHMIDLAQGYDERLNGGTGGTDNDIAWRMEALGLKCIFIPDLVVYHVDTTGLPRRPMKGLCQGPHDRNPFTYNQYHRGDPNLVENEQLRTFVEEGIKFLVCKECGACGVIDSQEVLKSNMRHRTLVPPSYAAGHPRARLLAARKEMRAKGYNHSTRCVICST